MQQKNRPIRRRDILILASIWLVGCSIVVVLLGLFYANSVSQTPEPPQPAVTPLVISAVAGSSAKNAYLPASAQAQAWQSNVELVAASRQWVDATPASLSESGIWDFRFFSPGHKRLLFVIVPPSQDVISRPHLPEINHKPGLIDPANWVIDSHEALSIWVNQGGGAFLEAFPGNRLELILRQSPASQKTLWEIIGISADQSQIMYLTIDATTGQVLN